MDNLDFGAIKDAIDQFTELVKAFAQIIKDFVNSWKKELKFEVEG